MMKVDAAVSRNYPPAINNHTTTCDHLAPLAAPTNRPYLESHHRTWSGLSYGMCCRLAIALLLAVLTTSRPVQGASFSPQVDENLDDVFLSPAQAGAMLRSKPRTNEVNDILAVKRDLDGWEEILFGRRAAVRRPHRRPVKRGQNDADMTKSLTVLSAIDWLSRLGTGPSREISSEKLPVDKPRNPKEVSRSYVDDDDLTDVVSDSKSDRSIDQDSEKKNDSNRGNLLMSVLRLLEEYAASRNT